MAREALAGECSYLYNGMGNRIFADIIFFENGTATVYELKHDSSYGRTAGEKQLKGYIIADNGKEIHYELDPDHTGVILWTSSDKKLIQMN